MKLIAKLVFSFFIILSFTDCSGIKKFKIDISSAPGVSYEIYFDKGKLVPLKKEWKELYLFLKKGHLLRSEGKESVTFIHSYQLYTLLRLEREKVYNTPFLQDYENFLITFGKPDNIQVVRDRIFITYTRFVVDNPCEACQHDLFAFTFDKKSKRLLRE